MEWWQAFLNGLGATLAWLYDLVPNYGLAIILLTLLIRVALLPLAIKQIRSMHAMQAIQPQVKALQQKYKGDRQKLNTEMMNLYKERGVNPLSGCLPLLLQFPVLIALFAVLRVDTATGRVQHIPGGSELHAAIVRQDTDFLGANLQCSATQAGRTVPIQDPIGEIRALECGRGWAVRIPYYALALAMIGTTYYQSRQMQRASPGPANPQAQLMTRVMPVLFGIWGFLFPAGLVLYWTTTNVVQIGQQHFMFARRGAVTEAKPGGGDRRASGSAVARKSEGASQPGAEAVSRLRQASGERRAGQGKRSAGEKRTPHPSDREKAKGSGDADGASRKKRRKR